MPRAKDDEIASRVNAKSDELISEFRSHLEEYKSTYSEDADERLIFEGWAIQKIAGLQCIVLDLTEKLNQVAARLK